MRTLLMTTLYSVSLLTAGQQMNVAVCNLSDVRASVIARGKAEAGLVYGSAGVQIVWHECNAFPPPPGQVHAAWFLVRLRTDKPPQTTSASSLDVMGKAFVDENGGYMADAYFQAIQATSQQHSEDSGVLLGSVMAHELGHLLLGPGHTPDGVMQAAWGPKQIDVLRQRWMRFNENSAARIQRALEARTAASNIGGR